MVVTPVIEVGSSQSAHRHTAQILHENIQGHPAATIEVPQMS